MVDLKVIKDTDKEVYDSLVKELDRQRTHIELIASENIVSPAVMAAMGSFFTNKYAEGYPGKRYYGGCEHYDVVENLAIDRVKKLFGAEHANVQPHSGAQANMAVFYALLKPGDKVLGMNLAHGGHLSHGSKVNLSGKWFEVVAYGVDKDTYLIDYDELERVAVKEKPKLIIAGASAYSREIDFKRFRKVADKVGAYLMADIAHIAGLVAAGLQQNPVKYCDIVTSTTHKTLRGPRGGIILCKEKFAKQIDKAVFPGIQGGPLMHTIAAKAICFKEALSKDFKDYQKRVKENADVLAKQLIKRGIKLLADGTDNHLILINVGASGKTGAEVEDMLDRANITVNKNSIPFDKLKPSVTSGIRIGTPAVTTRNMGKKDMVLIADCIADIILEGESAVKGVKSKIEKLCKDFPLYASDVIM